jgi:hypothetical protein
MSGFISTVQLLGRYTELAHSPEFQAWLREHGGEFWHETHASEDEHVTVVVQSLDRSRLYAALIKNRPGTEVNDFTTEIVDTADIPLGVNNLLRHQALGSLMSELSETKSRILAVRPVVDFNEDPQQTAWEIELTDDARVDKFLVAQGEVRRIETLELDFLSAILPFMSPIPPAVPTNDWLEENELHHPSVLQEEAARLADGANTVLDKALKIFFHVRDNYSYDSNILGINEFTWADLLVNQQLNRRGVCDELAVVAISYLRALAIPAVLKILHFTYGGVEAAHACLEFFDGARWIHMDTHKRVVDLPSIYRSLGWKNITVMDANSPLDCRSIMPVWGSDDLTGDGKLSTYDDFLLTPAYPGCSRTGYSY